MATTSKTEHAYQRWCWKWLFHQGLSAMAFTVSCWVSHPSFILSIHAFVIRRAGIFFSWRFNHQSSLPIGEPVHLCQLPLLCWIWSMLHLAWSVGGMDESKLNDTSSCLVTWRESERGWEDCYRDLVCESWEPLQCTRPSNQGLSTAVMTSRIDR